MQETNLLCDLSLMYTVVRGMCSIIEEDSRKMREANSLEIGAVDSGIWWLRDQMDRLWPALRDVV